MEASSSPEPKSVADYSGHTDHAAYIQQALHRKFWSHLNMVQQISKCNNLRKMEAQPVFTDTTMNEKNQDRQECWDNCYMSPSWPSMSQRNGMWDDMAKCFPFIQVFHNTFLNFTTSPFRSFAPSFWILQLTDNSQYIAPTDLLHIMKIGKKCHTPDLPPESLEKAHNWLPKEDLMEISQRREEDGRDNLRNHEEDCQEANAMEGCCWESMSWIRDPKEWESHVLWG